MKSHNEVHLMRKSYPKCMQQKQHNISWGKSITISLGGVKQSIKCHEEISWHLIRAEKHDISLGFLVAAPKAWNITRSLCSKKAWTLSQGNLGTAKKAQHQKQKLGSWKARRRIRKRRHHKDPQKTWKSREDISHAKPRLVGHNRIWDKGQKAMKAHKGKLTTAIQAWHFITKSHQSITVLSHKPHIHTLLQGAAMGRHSISHVLQHHTTISLPSLTAQSSPPTPNPPPGGALQITQ
jgi:hypothetical protein